jgi:hypothetical protein
MLHPVGRQGRTRFTVDRRQYFLEEFVEGIAELVRAERRDEGALVRVLESVYWWPEHEGKAWPALIVPGPEWAGLPPQPDTWAHFEKAIGVDERYRWEAYSGPDIFTGQSARKVPVYAVLRLELDAADPELAVAITEVLPTLEEADAEVQRLNRLNADKNCRYVSRTTRYFSAGRHGREGKP